VRPAVRLKAAILAAVKSSANPSLYRVLLILVSEQLTSTVGRPGADSTASGGLSF